MAGSGLATRLYRGEAGIDIVGRRKLWYSVAVALTLIAILGFGLRGFTFGIEFSGGNKISVPASVGTLVQAEDQMAATLGGNTADGHVVSAQQAGNAEGQRYEFRTTELTPEEAENVKAQLATAFGIDASAINESRVSGSWGAQVSNRALLGLVVFVALVTLYLIIRLEWRMAVAAVSSLLLGLAVVQWALWQWVA